MAVHYRETGFVLVFNSASRICRSDVLILHALLETLNSGVDQMRTHRHNDGSLRDSDPVDPSMFPLIHGGTKVLLNGPQIPR